MPLSNEEKFKALCEFVRTLPKDGEFQLSNEAKLKFYGYFKQATEGNIKSEQPYFFNVVERAKWDQWNSLKDMSKEECMQNYINEMRKALESAPTDNEIYKNLDAIVKG